MKPFPAVAAVLLWACVPALASEPIEIKGIRLGMSQFDIQDKHGQLPLENFTIGGVRSKYRVSPDFLNGEMQSMRIFFDSDGFDQVREVVSSKYPKLACRNSDVTNRLGAKFTQTECYLRGSDGVLSLRRFSSDLSTSSLSLVGNAELARQRKASEAADRDI